MYKKRKVVMLPTDKTERCILILKHRNNMSAEYHGNKYFTRDYLQSINAVGYHLYILSDDEIKLGDYYTGGKFVETCSSCPEQTNMYAVKKIIASTDSSLHDHNNSYVNWIPSIPQSFIDKYVSEYNKGNKIEEVMVEYEPIGNWRHAEFVHTNDILKLNPDNTINIQSVKDSWTKEEVKRLLITCCSEISSTDGILKGKSPAELYDWIESNLY
jgi:hypothetical protein